MSITIIRHENTVDGFSLVASYTEQGKFTVAFQVYKTLADSHSSLIIERIFSDERAAIDIFNSYSG